MTRPCLLGLIGRLILYYRLILYRVIEITYMRFQVGWADADCIPYRYACFCPLLQLATWGVASTKLYIACRFYHQGLGGCLKISHNERRLCTLGMKLARYHPAAWFAVLAPLIGSFTLGGWRTGFDSGLGSLKWWDARSTAKTWTLKDGGYTKRSIKWKILEWYRISIRMMMDDA